MTNKNIIPIVISAPSGVGKTTLRDAAIEKLGSTYKLRKVITTTTRSPRDKEVHNVDYIFLTPEDFDKKVANDEFIEYTNVHGHMYGCLKETVDSIMAEGFYPLIILDVVGKSKFDKVYPDNISIFLEPPPLEVIRERLESRNTTEEDITTRLEAVSREVAESKSGYYTFRVGNEQDLNTAVSNFCNLIEYIVSASQVEDTRSEEIKHLERIYETLAESELFMLIEGMTAVLWSIDNQVKAEDVTEQIEKQYKEIKTALGMAIEYTKKFRVKEPFIKLNDSTITTSEDYQRWFSFWSEWKSLLKPEQWKDVDEALKAGSETIPHLPLKGWDE